KVTFDGKAWTQEGYYVGASNDKVWHEGNDGTGSGLDADKLDGKHASNFATASHTHNASQVSIVDSNENFTSTSVEGALNELFTSVSNGKTGIASAITDKGVPASGSDSFSTLATKIGQIETSGGFISSIQSGNATLDVDNPSKNITINTINTNRAVILVTSASYQIRSAFVAGKIVDSTTINLYRATNADAKSDISWQVIEFGDGVVKSLQKDSYYFSSSNGTVTINPIDPSKALLLFSFYAGGTDTLSIMRGYIYDSTTLKFYKQGAGSAYFRVEWQVVEFY
ncbi:MAG: hypothetical protein GX921_07370, partial [Bacteroidales bacterium]|nr:hypothetical protein [Bacteroidales bacterium]